MAQKVTILLVDDIDGTEAEETVTFGLDGTTYEIDLSASNATHLRNTMEGFVKAARTANGTRRRRKRTTTSSLASVPSMVTVPVKQGPDPAVVRAWAKENGIHVGIKGRVARSVVKQYEEAMEQQAS